MPLSNFGHEWDLDQFDSDRDTTQIAQVWITYATYFQETQTKCISDLDNTVTRKQSLYNMGDIELSLKNIHLFEIILDDHGR